MTDILLQKFFEKERWEQALELGVGKGIDKGELRKLTSPEIRLAMYNCIISDNYEIAPPHQAQIPKDNGDMRIVYVNENVDRIFLSIVNNLFFEMFPEFVHKSCKSYQSGIGCGKIVQEVSRQIINTNTREVGAKNDLTKYFDRVPIRYIDEMFDRMEHKVGKSKIIDIVRRYYHADLCFDVDGNLIEHYQSLKQGCAVASFLADAVLYHIDAAVCKLDVYYVRYSDDLLVLGKEWREAQELIKTMLEDMELELNPKKVEIVCKDRWVKFLGFNIKGDQITLSATRVKSFQKEIASRTIKQRDISMTRAVNSVNNFLYKGDGRYSWATSVLPIINVDKDIETLNTYVMDALRACATKKTKIGGLGSVNDQPDHTILRGTGKNVTANRMKTEKEIPGYLTLKCMQNAILTRRAVYETLVRCM
ncbi:MAG: reverse transcriptase domain-containing protein [Paludibacteraceae bacterium]|nr:reverse transcriptase domain-containing protein [Paludibacteraceae bacterium]